MEHENVWTKVGLMAVSSIVVLSLGCGKSGQPSIDQENPEFFEDVDTQFFACKKATKSQLAQVNAGNSKKSTFLKKCSQTTGGSAWCNELIRPNPKSIGVFRCTYGEKQVHQLIHPETSAWNHAVNAVKLVQELQQKGIKVCQIYNWWRPEPYNQNVGGAPGRHPKGTSVDVRFCSVADANKAFDELCKARQAGRIRAIGHYGTSALHFGVGDSTGNTWGRKCPGDAMVLASSETHDESH